LVFDWWTYFVFCSVQRPLLAILDRNIDLATPLHHGWTYQALAHDLLGLSVCPPVLRHHSLVVDLKTW
jgi:hypothetical protein